ncbi:Protein kinase domain containing protein, partial [Reticulomyxa filosa]
SEQTPKSRQQPVKSLEEMKWKRIVELKTTVQLIKTKQKQKQNGRICPINFSSPNTCHYDDSNAGDANNNNNNNNGTKAQGAPLQGLYKDNNDVNNQQNIRQSATKSIGLQVEPVTLTALSTGNASNVGCVSKYQAQAFSLSSFDNLCKTEDVNNPFVFNQMDEEQLENEETIEMFLSHPQEFLPQQNQVLQTVRDVLNFELVNVFEKDSFHIPLKECLNKSIYNCIESQVSILDEMLMHLFHKKYQVIDHLTMFKNIYLMNSGDLLSQFSNYLFRGVNLLTLQSQSQSQLQLQSSSQHVEAPKLLSLSPSFLNSIFSFISISAQSLLTVRYLFV